MLTASLQRHSPEAAHDPASSRILLCGKAFTADPTGALYWPAEKTLIVADLQLGRCSYLDAEDVVLPPYDTVSAFEKLEEALDRYDPVRVIALGDSFAGVPSDGFNHHQADWLFDMMEGREWYWVMSNLNSPVPEGVGGTAVPHMMLGGLRFRADPVRAPISNEIAGALHPVAQVSHYGHVVRGRCFVSNGMRMILPALGNYSAGANVLSEAFEPLLGHGMFVWFIGGERVYAVAPVQLHEDRAA